MDITRMVFILEAFMRTIVQRLMNSIYMKCDRNLTILNIYRDKEIKFDIIVVDC